MQQSPSWAKHCETQMQERENAPAFDYFISDEWYLLNKYTLTKEDIREKTWIDAGLYGNDQKVTIL